MKNIYKFTIATIFLLSINTGSIAQSMTYFQYSGQSTWAADVDGDNILGHYINSSYTSNVGFITNDQGSTFQTLSYPGENHTYPQGIDGSNIVGYYKDNSAVSHGFMYNGFSWTTLDHPSGYQTEMLAVSGNNYVGYYYDGSNYHGCLYNSNTDSWTAIDRPSYANTKFTGIYGNNIVGNSGNSYSNVNTGFMYNLSTGVWTSIDYGVGGDPNSPQMAWYESTNIEGVDATHVLAYYKTSGQYKCNFVYEISSGNYSLFAYDQTSGKEACGIDGLDNVVGYSEGGGVSAYHFQEVEPPTVTTQAVSAINATTATGNGNITNLGEENPTQYGVCWNTTGNPTTSDDKTEEGSTSSTGSFTSSITGLTEGETYYVRAYATNSGGTSYGDQVSFTAVASATETWTIYLSDSYGDGWNGGFINVLINGSAVLSNLTILDGSTESYEFDVSCDDVISTQFTAGGWPEENSFQIKNHENTIVAESGQGGSTPQNISHTYDCPETPGTVSTQAVSNKTTTTATGNGNITSIGTTSISAHGVCWNTSGNPTTGDSSTDEGAGSSTGSFTCDITGLSPGTTYYVKAYITDETGTIYGDQVSLETTYIVSTQSASGITSTSATGNGTIVTIGGSSITAHGICWNTSGSPTTSSSSTDEGATESTGTFTSDITGLTSSTTYYVRAYITDGTGTYYGNQISFQSSFEAIFEGSGTEGDPYQITNLTDLKNFSENSYYWSKHLIQTADIDASSSSAWNGGEGLSAISFSGSYNGQNHTITGLFINKGIYGRAFFTSANGASISNLGLVDVDFTCWGNVGAFIGSSSGTTSINSCFCTGSVTGNFTNAGGLVGYVGGTITINNCYSRVTAYGKSYSGGLIGRAQGTIVMTNSYNSGSVQGPGTNGGLFAHNYYSWGDYNTITNCFWDTETSGQSTSFDDGTGLSTDDMKTQSIFTDAGWDFADIWNMDDYTNNGYPFLKWQGGTNAWTGATNSDWNTATNWAGNEVPSSLIDHVLIPNVTNDPIIADGGTATCKNLTINSGAILTIESGGSLNTAGTITNNGIFNAQRSIANGRWHMISSPVSNAVSGMFSGDFLQTWNEGDAWWYEVSETDVTLTPTDGYGFWSNGTGSDIHTFTGTPNTGVQSIALTAAGSGGSYNRANLIGNPYPSSINWAELDDTYGAVHYYNGTTYVSWNNGSGSGFQNIPPMQGFFIVPSESGSFTVNNSNRTHEGASNFSKSKSTIKNGIIISASNSHYDDDLWIKFDVEANDDFDFCYDAHKFFTNVEGISQIYSKYNDHIYSIDVRPESESIALGFKNDLNGHYSIKKKQMDGISTVELEDTKLNTFHNLTAGAYSFDWQTTDSEERFILHLKATGLAEEAKLEVLIYTSNKLLYVRIDSAEDYKNMQIYDLSGRLINEDILKNQKLQSFDVSTLNGAYLVKLIGKKKTITKKVVLRK